MLAVCFCLADFGLKSQKTKNVLLWNEEIYKDNKQLRRTTDISGPSIGSIFRARWHLKHIEGSKKGRTAEFLENLMCVCYCFPLKQRPILHAFFTVHCHIYCVWNHERKIQFISLIWWPFEMFSFLRRNIHRIQLLE